MAKIKWAEICELALVDNRDRLCLIGVTTRFPVPSLPLFVRQIMIAARIIDVQPGSPLSVGLSMATPSGLVATPNQTDDFDVSIAAEYILITLRQVPLTEEGIYRFEVSLGNENPISLEVAVELGSKSEDLESRGGDPFRSAFKQTPRPSQGEVN